MIAPILEGWSANRKLSLRRTAAFPTRSRIQIVGVISRSIKGDVKNIFLPPLEAGIFSATSSPSHHWRRSCGVLPLGLGWCCSISAAASSFMATTPSGFWKSAKPCGCMVSTMVLS